MISDGDSVLDLSVEVKGTCGLGSVNASVV